MMEILNENLLNLMRVSATKASESFLPIARNESLDYFIQKPNLHETRNFLTNKNSIFESVNIEPGLGNDKMTLDIFNSSSTPSFNIGIYFDLSG